MTATNDEGQTAAVLPAGTGDRMALVTIREATAGERERAGAQWARALRADRAPRGPFGPMLRSPASPSTDADGVVETYGHQIAPSLWRFAMEGQIDRTMEQATVMVADYVQVPGEPCGWIAYEGERVHFVHVLGPARRRGIGRTLLVHAGCTMATYLTPAGRALMTSVARERAAVQTTDRSGSTREEDGTCRTSGGTPQRGKPALQ